MGRDIMDKLGLRLTMAPQQKQDEKQLLNIPNTHQKNIQMDISKIPTPMYETRHIKKPCSKIHIQKRI